MANLDTSDTGFSSDEDESSGERGCAVGGAENAVDKFSVRPKINNIYEQVRNNLPAIEDNLSVSYFFLFVSGIGFSCWLLQKN